MITVVSMVVITTIKTHKIAVDTPNDVPLITNGSDSETPIIKINVNYYHLSSMHTKLILS